MIIFDTNILRGVTRRNPKFDVLRVLKRSGVQSAGIPWMVLEELTAKQVLEYTSSYEQAAAAIRSLNRRIPWAIPARFDAVRETERASEYWRGQYEEVLEIIPTSEESAKEALAREAYCQKPAKTDPGSKGGARDAAIWLSVVQYLKKNPAEEVFFVTNNTDDFGDGTRYPEPMASDLGDMQARLTILTSFDEVIARFTEQIEVSDGEVRRLLEIVINDPASALSASASKRTGIYTGTFIGDGRSIPVHWFSWKTPPSALIRSVGNGSGHRIGDHEWYTATVDWALIGDVDSVLPVRLLGSPKAPMSGQIACQWHTKVLFSVGGNLEFTIVDYDSPTELDPDDRAVLQSLIDRSIGISSEQEPPALSVLVAQFLEEQLSVNSAQTFSEIMMHFTD